MNSQKKPHLPARIPAGPRKQLSPAVAQPKLSPARSQLRQPTAPPVYRPQPVPKVLQRKTATSQVPPGARPPQRPVAPPVYRPQSAPRVLQAKQPPLRQPAAQTKRPPAAPPVYRPQPTPKVLQTKKRTAAPQRPASGPARPPVAPPAYRPEPKRTVQLMADAARSRPFNQRPNASAPRGPLQSRPSPRPDTIQRTVIKVSMHDNVEDWESAVYETELVSVANSLPGPILNPDKDKAVFNYQVNMKNGYRSSHDNYLVAHGSKGEVMGIAIEDLADWIYEGLRKELDENKNKECNYTHFSLDLLACGVGEKEDEDEPSYAYKLQDLINSKGLGDDPFFAEVRASPGAVYVHNADRLSLKEHPKIPSRINKQIKKLRDQAKQQVEAALKTQKSPSDIEAIWMSYAEEAWKVKVNALKEGALAQPGQFVLSGAERLNPEQADLGNSPSGTIFGTFYGNQRLPDDVRAAIGVAVAQVTNNKVIKVPENVFKLIHNHLDIPWTG